MGDNMDMRLAFACWAKHVPRPGFRRAGKEDNMVGRRQMPQLARMAYQTDRLSRSARQWGQVGIVNKRDIGSADGGAKLAMKNGTSQQVSSDHRCGHGDQADACHAGQSVHSSCCGWQHHDMLMAALRQGCRIGPKCGGDATCLAVGGDGQTG